MGRRVAGSLYETVKKEVEALRSRVYGLESETRILRETAQQGTHELQQARAHIQVLASDRDRLTATVEILSRRLASPAADSDPSRAGWRSTNATTAAAQGKAS